MLLTNLRKVGGSVMLAVPPTLLELLDMQVGEEVGISLERGRLVIDPHPKPRYTLDALLAQCDAKARILDEDRAWLRGGPVGDELI